MRTMMTDMMAWMGLGGLLVLIVLVLIAAAAVKYLFFSHRNNR